MLSVPEEAIPEENSPTTPKETLTVESELSHIGFGRFQYIALCILGLANASDAVELLCLSFILPLLDGTAASKCDKSLEDPGAHTGSYTPSSKALLSAGIFIGMLVGGLVFGVGADYMGRRRTLAFSLSINAFFGLLSAVTPNFEVLFLCRVFSGFGVGGSIPGVFTMAAEILPAKGRAFWLSTVAWWWMVGSIYAAGLAWLLLGYLCMNWQWYAALCTIPAAAASMLTLLLPESPRYLHGKGDTSGAAAALVTIARWSGRTSRLSQGWSLDPTVNETDDSDDESVVGGSIGGSDLSDEELNVLVTGTEKRVGEKDHGAVASASVVVRSVKGGAESETEALGLLSSDRKSGLVSSEKPPLFMGKSRTSVKTLSVSQVFAPLLRMFQPRNIRTTFLLSFVWFTLSFGWYGLIMWLPVLYKQVGLDEFQVCSGLKRVP